MSNVLPSKPVFVRFFEDRAEVTRVAAAELAAGRQWLRVGGISPLIDDRSVQAACGQARVLAARVGRAVTKGTELAASEIAALEKKESELEKQLAALDTLRSRHEKRLEYLAELQGAWAEGAAKVPRIRPDASLESWSGAWRDLCSQDADELEKLHACEREHARLEQQLGAIQAELSMLRSRRPRHEAFIEVYLDASSPVTADLKVTYRVPCALWRPEHAARLEPDARSGGRVVLTTFATVWQRTGEEWLDVEAAFSTARPAQAASPPPLNDDIIVKRKKSPEEQKKIVVEAREQTIEEAAAAKAPEMPGVDDGGEPLEFAAKGRVTLRSTGLPVRVEIARVELAAEVARVLMAERSPTAHLRASCANTGKTPLLAGPVRVARQGTLIGRSRLDFVGVGEHFALGVGPDDSLRCRRQFEEKRETGLMGGQTVTHDVALYLSNLAGEPRELLIIERVPVSEVEGLEVRAPEPKDWAPDKDGFMKRTVTLEANAVQELKYRYELYAKSIVVLP